MRFLVPLFLAGAALVALPIVLHLLRRDVAPEVPFTAVRLLRGTPVDRSRSRRLRDLLLLAARIAALLLLAASFARPYRAQTAGSRPLTIIALDRSFSMGAPGVFDRARGLARQEVDGAKGRIAVIAFDDRADVIAPAGLAADARDALARITPGAGATRYAPLCDKVAEIAEGETSVRLVLVSDLQKNGLEGAAPSLPAGVELVARDAGGPAANLALTDLRLDGSKGLAVVRNFGDKPAAATLSVSGDGVVLTSQPVTVAPRATTQVPFDVRRARTVKASIGDADGYPADNERFAVAQAADPPRVVLVTGGPGTTNGFYLSRALLASEQGRADFDVVSMQGPAFAAVPAGELGNVAAIVVLSTHGLDRRAADTFRAFFQRGGGVLVAASPDVDPTVLSTLFGWNPPLTEDDTTGAGVLAVSDLRHPIFRPFDAVAANLGHVSFQHAWHVSTDPAWRTIAAFSGGGAALLERQADSGRVLLFSSDLDRRWNDFPLHASFVPFVQETVRYLGAKAPANPSILVADVPDGTLPAPGIVTSEGSTRAVNVDSRESATDHLSPSELAASITRQDLSAARSAQRRASQVEAQQGLWRYGLALMLLTLVVEAFVGSR